MKGILLCMYIDILKKYLITHYDTFLQSESYKEFMKYIILCNVDILKECLMMHYDSFLLLSESSKEFMKGILLY